MSGYQLGQRVTMSGSAEKVRDTITWRPKNSQRIYTEAIDAWATMEPLLDPYEGGILRTRLIEAPAKSAEGIVIGKRTVQQGITESESFGEPACFFPCEIGEVWLVAFHLRRKPVMCFDHQLAAIETGPTITVPAPHVPYPGPHDTDATFMRGAAKKIAGDYSAGGSNVKRAVIKLLNDAADAMEAQK